MAKAVNEHERWMSEALELARRGRGRTSPNPMVGCVIVRGGAVVGRGWHKRAGAPHAEVPALKQAGARARGATLYVTLEPCSHTGRTPPCAPRIVEADVARVVAAAKDPNPLVSGRGFRILRRAGIEVVTGVLKEQAAALNEAYFHFITTGKPFVIMKGAMTLDGKIATSGGESKWITGAGARRDVHELRREADAVLVGVGTLLKDDPSLDCRLPGNPPQPLRVVLDSNLRTRPGLKFCRNAVDGKSVIITGAGADPRKAVRLEKLGCTVLRVRTLKNGRPAVPAALDALAKMDVTNVLVEGGGAVHDAFLRAGCVNKVVVYVAPKILGGANSHTLVDGPGFPGLDKSLNLTKLDVQHLGRDIRITGYPEK